MFNPNNFENSRPGGIGVLEVVEAAGGVAEQPRRFVPLQSTELRGEVDGPLATLHLTHIYAYTAQECDQVLEAIYRFPLPGDAAVTAMRVRFGDVQILAELKERQQAEVEYEEARQQGRQAALATRESPNVFTLQIAGLRPNQEVTVETTYTQLARPEASGWSLRIPLTTAPRYTRSDELETRHAAGQPLTLLRDPGLRFSLDLTVRPAGTIQSPTHKLDITQRDGQARVQLQGAPILPDRDCVIRWTLPQDQQRPTLHIVTYSDPANNYTYFLALVAPPTVTDQRGAPREVILLVDHSGSMEGPKWAAADWTVKSFLNGLTKQDTFALGLFHNTTQWYTQELHPEYTQVAEPKELEKAIHFLDAHKDSGGTELGVALEQALGIKRLMLTKGQPGAYTRHVLVITDAQVTDAGRILRLADSASANPADARRISVICIDAAPNDFLAREMAERGGGVARFLTSSPEEQDISTALDELLADWAAPVMTGLRLAVNRPGLQAAGRQVSADTNGGSWIDLGDLPAGRAVWAVGRIPAGEDPTLDFQLTSARGGEVVAYHPAASAQTAARPALKALFGAGRVLGLEFLIHSGFAGAELEEQLRRLGYDPAQVLADRSAQPAKVYAENVHADAHQLLRDLLVREALYYGLASAETAFVATRTEAGQPVAGTVFVANALPSGWSASFLGRGLLASASPAMFTDFSISPPAPSGRQAGASPLKAQAAKRSSRISQVFQFDESATPAPARSVICFSGVPSFAQGTAVLVDSARSQDLFRQAAQQMPGGVTISGLVLRFPAGTPKPAEINPELHLLIYVEDLITPRARMRLADLLRQQGERPLNLLKLPQQVIKIELVDPQGAWATHPPQLELSLAY